MKDFKRVISVDPDTGTEMVAVVVDSGSGWGWSTSSKHHKEILAFHPEIVHMVLNDKKDEITKDFLRNLMNDPKWDMEIFTRNLEVQWVEKGVFFHIRKEQGRPYCREVLVFDYYVG